MNAASLGLGVVLLLASATQPAQPTFSQASLQTPPEKNAAQKNAAEKKEGGGSRGQCGGGGLRYEQKIPGTSIALTMLAVPPGDHPKLWISSTEVPWEAYDAFVFGFDKKDPTLPNGAEAAARPSQPYITMDHSFGHAGYPVISVSSLGATSFCEWLSKATGCKFRLPTEAEWEAAARADGAQQDLDLVAWTKANAEKKTHPIGAKAANAWGFHDMLGNAAEWCVGKDGRYVVRGGSYKDGPEGASVTASVPSDPAWNKSDPQIPKSKWWLADGGFIGFRVAREE